MNKAESFTKAPCEGRTSRYRSCNYRWFGSWCGLITTHSTVQTHKRLPSHYKAKTRVNQRVYLRHSQCVEPCTEQSQYRTHHCPRLLGGASPAASKQLRPLGEIYTVTPPIPLSPISPCSLLALPPIVLAARGLASCSILAGRPGSNNRSSAGDARGAQAR